MIRSLELIALRSDYTIQSILRPTNIQWSRKYYEPGTFSVQLPISQYSGEMMYVYTKDRDEMGIISQRNYVIDNLGFRYMQISGYFLESELNDKVVNPLYIADGILEDKVVEMVNTYKKDIPLLENAVSLGRGTVVQFQESNMELGKKCYELLKEQEMSYKMSFDFESSKKRFSVYQGKNRTQSQSENNFVVFSTRFGNLKEPNVVSSSTDYKNYAIIGGQGEGADRIMTSVDLSGGGYKKEIFIDASSVEYDKEKMTLAQYISSLQKYGLTQMITNHSMINNVEFDVLEGSYEYLTDFDVGDKCDTVINEMDLVMEARIIGAYEVVKNGNHTVSLEFGDQIFKK